MALSLVISALIGLTFGQDPNIWPLPSTFTVSPTRDLSLALTFNITTTSTSQILQRGIDRYMREIIMTHVPDGTPKAPLVTSLAVTAKVPDETLQLGVDESYTLNIKEGESTLSANTIYGALKGLETFSQLVVYNFTFGYYQTSTSTITDVPRFKWRGILIDTSRHYQSVRSIKRLLESMSFAKLNVLHWHITDTQSFPFTSKVYPLFASKGAFGPYQQFSLNDIADIVSYAQERGIRVVPEFDVCYIILLQS